MLRNLFCIFIAGAATAVFFPLTILSMIFALIIHRRRTGAMWVVRKLWSPTLLWAGGAALHVTGLENVDPKLPMIFAANHQSTIDIPVLFCALPVDLRFVAKKSLQYVPFLGWYMWLSNFVFVDRQNRNAALESLEQAGKRIRSGLNIIMFPEGTRSETNEVLAFKKGPFALAMAARVPVVPVAIEGSGALMPKNSWNITPGPIRVAIGKPIDTVRFGDDREALLSEVREAVISLQVSLGGRGGKRKNIHSQQETA